METMLATVLAAASENGEKVVPLPMPPIAFGLLTLGGFVALFAITWAFRSVASRH